jgi:hypothetical protein
VGKPGPKQESFAGETSLRPIIKVSIAAQFTSGGLGSFQFTASESLHLMTTGTQNLYIFIGFFAKGPVMEMVNVKILVVKQLSNPPWEEAPNATRVRIEHFCAKLSPMGGLQIGGVFLLFHSFLS